MGIALVAACIVGAVSSIWGDQWARDDVAQRFSAIEATLANATFPLTSNVVTALSRLTGCELITTIDGALAESSIEVDVASFTRLTAPKEQGSTIEMAGRAFVRFHTVVIPPYDQSPVNVDVLFPTSSIDATRRRAAMLPLLTGFSTIAALILVTLWIANRTSWRIVQLQQRVTRIAEGDFEVRCEETVPDEIGALGSAVDSMASQLKTLWQEFHRQHAAKLLHQISGGLAHQLRNTLTGSKMAIELHARTLSEPSEEVRVAIQQLRNAEEYVTRLSLIDGGREEPAKQRVVSACVRDLRASLAPIARHRGCELEWSYNEETLNSYWTHDSSAFQAALSNLVLNAMEAANAVRVCCEVDAGGAENAAGSSTRDVTLLVRVSDNGMGIDESVRQNLFDPFVTSKPEGMGLGLPLVKRSAERLGGSITWSRIDGWTVFSLQCRIQSVDGEVGMQPGKQLDEERV